MSEAKKDQSSCKKEMDHSQPCQRDCKGHKKSARCQQTKNNPGLEGEQSLNMKNSTNNDLHFDLLKYQDYLTYGTYDRIHFDMLFRRYR